MELVVDGRAAIALALLVMASGWVWGISQWSKAVDAREEARSANNRNDAAQRELGRVRCIEVEQQVTEKALRAAENALAYWEKIRQSESVEMELKGGRRN